MDEDLGKFLEDDKDPGGILKDDGDPRKELGHDAVPPEPLRTSRCLKAVYAALIIRCLGRPAGAGSLVYVAEHGATNRRNPGAPPVPQAHPGTSSSSTLEYVKMQSSRDIGKDPWLTHFKTVNHILIGGAEEGEWSPEEHPREGLEGRCGEGLDKQHSGKGLDDDPGEILDDGDLQGRPRREVLTLEGPELDCLSLRTHHSSCRTGPHIWYGGLGVKLVYLV